MTRKTESKEPETSKFQLFLGAVFFGCLFLGMLSGWSWSGLLVLFLIFAYIEHKKRQRRKF